MLSWGRGRLKKGHCNHHLTRRHECQLAPWILMHQSLSILPHHLYNYRLTLVWARLPNSQTNIKIVMLYKKLCEMCRRVENHHQLNKPVLMKRLDVNPMQPSGKGWNWDCHSHHLSLPFFMATQLSTYGLEQISGTKLNVKNNCLAARDWTIWCPTLQAERRQWLRTTMGYRMDVGWPLKC